MNDLLLLGGIVCSNVALTLAGFVHGRDVQSRVILTKAAQELRLRGSDRMQTHGMNDARGAALWDAGCFIDPDDGDALNVGQGSASPCARRQCRGRLQHSWATHWFGGLQR